MKQRQLQQRSKRPSYEEGELRDKSIEKVRDPTFRESEFQFDATLDR